jgi:hypothetical protein
MLYAEGRIYFLAIITVKLIKQTCINSWVWELCALLLVGRKVYSHHAALGYPQHSPVLTAHVRSFMSLLTSRLTTRYITSTFETTLLNKLRVNMYHELQNKVSFSYISYEALNVGRWIQKFPDWPPGARTANGTALYHWVQLYRYFVRQSSEFCCHNPLCYFSTSVYCCKHIFRYRLRPETFGYTLVKYSTTFLEGPRIFTQTVSSIRIEPRTIKIWSNISNIFIMALVP